MPRQPEPHLGAGRVAAQLGRSAVTQHPAVDRLPDAEAVGGDRCRIEAGAPVPDEHLHGVRTGFEVNRDGHARVLRRVQHGLPGGLRQGVLSGAQHGVTDGDDGDRVSVEVLDLARGPAQSLGEAAWIPGRVGEQPLAQLTFLRPCQAQDVRLGVRPVLDEREGLQDRVM